MKNLKSMMQNSSRVFLVLYLSTCFLPMMAMESCIERYQPELDHTAVRNILDENYETLTHEEMGYSQGTTEKYLTNPNYITDVLRKDGETIGFVNYVAYEPKFLTFHFGRRGFIHLMGVAKKHLRRGYGLALLQHAVAELKDRNVQGVALMVKRGNVGARSLYEKAGFVCPVKPQFRDVVPQLIYQRSFDVPSELLPQGNIIQRYPKTSLAVASLAVLFFVYRKNVLNYCGNLCG